MKKYLFILICISSFLFSCTENNKKKANETKLVKKAIGKLVTDSVAPPIVTPITPAKLLPVSVTSKPYSLDPRMGKEAITTITPANGLPLGVYNDFFQDPSGNIWFTNKRNIIKYDGYNFTSYPFVAADNARCTQIAMDNNKDLWVVVALPDSTGKNDLAKLYVFNGISFDPLPISTLAVTNLGMGVYFNNILFRQSDGTIWVVSSLDKQILKFQGRILKQTITLKDFSFKEITHIKTDKQGNTWFTDGKSSTVTRYDGKTFTSFERKDVLPTIEQQPQLDFSADSIYLFLGEQFLLDNQGILWPSSINSKRELVKWSSAGSTKIGRESGLETSGFSRIGFDSDDNAWVLSQNSLNRLYKPITQYGELFPNTAVSDNGRSFLNERLGNYWFGSIYSGISRYNGKTLTNYKLGNSNTETLTDNNIYKIIQDKAGNVWMGTFGGSLIKFDGKSFFNYNESKFFETWIVGSLMEDSKGNIWFTEADRSASKNNRVCYINERENVKVNFTTAQGLCNADVQCIFEDITGAIWFGTLNGLSRYKDGRFTTYGVEDGLAGMLVTAITADEFGNLWLGTNNGLSRFDGKRFVNYDTQDRLENESIEVIKKDTINNLFWVASDVGFTTMTIKANHPDSVVFENYSEAEGFPLKSIFTDFMIDQQGALWTSEGNNSIKRFDYKMVKENSKPFNLHITQIRLNNETVCWSNLKKDSKDTLALQMEMQLRFGKLLPREKIEAMATQFSGVRYDSIIPFDFIPYNLSLPYKANSISFDFAAIDPHFSKSTRYQYMLEGFDKTWSPFSKNTNANFGNLHEGSYRFKLKALNSYGKWSELSYSFKVLPPWYRTWWAYLMYILVIGSLVWLLVQSQKRKAAQKEREKVKDRELEQAKEIEKAYTELGLAHEDLKSTQAQLIQAEKMASLGELTAGIAHEIQNPLNFVNNFSEVNKELVDELQQELKSGKIDDAIEISNDIKENSEKINHHGKRAGDIVKGMLQHSRSSSGQKEPTNINALADEYLRLAYHGLRAKDKEFNATMKTDFDESIGNINIIPQDIGRVILNLINNAFYAVSAKASASADSEYEPTVEVSTKKVKDKVEVKVKDNGSGIPQKILDKIFQPFFTTKPTGQGTGLGLSLSYDIVKAHGGEIQVETKDGEGSTFIIRMPIA